MILDRYLAWLGFRAPGPVVGVHLTADLVTLAAVRSDPFRLVAIGSRVVAEAAVAGDDVRLVRAVADVVQELASRLRLPPGTPAVAAIEPSTGSLSFGDGPGEEPYCPVSQRICDQTMDVVMLAGLELVRVDPVPAALARIGRLAGAGSHGQVVVRASSPWSVRCGPGRVEAVRDRRWAARQHLAPGKLGFGADPDSICWVDALPGVTTPRRLRSAVDTGRDAVAVGAALAGLGLPPLLAVLPQPEPVEPSWGFERAGAEAGAADPLSGQPPFPPQGDGQA
jgi:hypothetical protein